MECGANMYPGAAGRPSQLSHDPATWQGHIEVSREKLIEGSSLTPLVLFSEGQSPEHSVGSWEKGSERNVDADQQNNSSHICCSLEEPMMN